MTKQNMPRLTESQLFTIEALNETQGFVWPEQATHAAMDLYSPSVHLYAYQPYLKDPIFLSVGGYLGCVRAPSTSPDWRNSLITREQFDGVDGWVRNSGTQPVSDECIVECKVDGPLGAIGCLPASVWNWKQGGLTHWRYGKHSSSEVNETAAITDPAPYFARRSFSWVGCENGFIIPDRIKEAEFNILGDPVIVILAEVDEILQEQDGSIFRAAHIDINLGEAICNHTNKNITAHVIRYLPIDAREVADHGIQPAGNLIQEVE